MPISQDRMLALLDIIETLRSSRETLARAVQAELDATIAEFHETDADGEQSPYIASNMLARAQSIASLILDNPSSLSETEMETYICEREHFRARRSSNILSARYMAKRRNQAT